MRTGAIFARGSCLALKWIALLGIVFALGVGSSAAQSTNADDLELKISSVTINGSSASTVTLDEDSTALVVVTLSAALPEADPDGTDTTVDLSVGVDGIQPTAGSFVTGEAEVGDVQIDGGDITDSSSLADLRTWDEGDRTVRFQLELDNDQGQFDDAVDEEFSLTFTLADLTGNGDDVEGDTVITLATEDDPANPGTPRTVTITKTIKIDDDDEQEYLFDIKTAADSRREDATIRVELEADPRRPEAEDIEVQLYLESDDADVARRYEIVGDSTADEHTFDETDANAVYEIDVRLRPALGNSDGDRDDDTIMLEADLTDPNHRRILTVEEEIVVKDIHGLPASDKITAKAYMDDDGDPGDDEAMSMMEGGDPVHVTVTVDRGDSGFPLGEDLEVSLVAADPDQRLDFSFPDGGNKLTIASGMDEQTATIKLEALEDRDVGPEDLVLNLVVTGKDDDNGPGERMGQPFSIAIGDVTPKLVQPKDGWEEAVKTAMGGDPEGDPPHVLNPGMDFMLMGGNLFEAGMIPVDITYSASVQGDAASVTVAGDTLTVTAGMVSGPAMATVTITATAERQGDSFLPTQEVDNVANVTFPVHVDLMPLAVTVTADRMEIMEGESATITATANRGVVGDTTIMLDVISSDSSDDHMLEIMIPDTMTSGSTQLGAGEDDDYDDMSYTVVATGPGIDGSQNLVISVTDNDEAPTPERTVKAQADPQSVFDANVGSDFVKDGDAVSFDAGMLFEEFGADVDPVFAVTSSDDMVVGAVMMGSMLTLTPAGYGSATIAVTVTDLTSDHTATASGDVMVGLADVSVMVAAADMMIDEGGSTMITATASRMLEGDERVTVNLAVVGEATLSADSIEIAADSDSGSVTLMSTDDDVHEQGEMVTVIASGAGIDGNISIEIAVTDNDDAPVVELTVTAKDDAAQMILDAVATAAGGADWMVGGMVATVDMADLFTADEGTSISYAGMSSSEAVMVGTSGTMLMLTPMAEGVSTITVTASDSASMDVARVDADVAVALQTLSISMAASADTVMEGGSVTLTATANRAVTAETMLTVTVTGDTDAVEADTMITIAMGQMAGTGMVMAVEDDDSADAMVAVVVSGDGISGGAASFDIAITDNDPTVSAKTSAEVDAVFTVAVATASGTDGWVPTSQGGEAAMLDMGDLFDTNGSPTLEYMAESSAADMVAVSASGSMLTLTPMAMGDATITVTATDSSGDMYDTATVMSSVMVGQAALEVTVSPETASIAEGGDSVEISAMLNRPAAANVEVMLIRDATSSAGEDDYSLAPSAMITVMAGETMGMATLTATDDVTVEGDESVTLVARVKDMGDVGTVMVSIMDNDAVSKFTLSGPMDTNLVEGQEYELTVTADPAVQVDTEVTIMRDRGASDADDADFTVGSVMLSAGDATGTTMLVVTDDGMDDSGHGMPEVLVLYGMANGESTNSLTFNIWDAAVPALPVIAQLLLAAFLALGGYRRYRRR